MLRLICSVTVYFLGLIFAGTVAGLKTNGNVAERAFVPDNFERYVEGNLKTLVDGLLPADPRQCVIMFDNEVMLHVELADPVDVNFVLLYATTIGEDGSFKSNVEGLKVYVGEELCTADTRGMEQRSSTAVIAAVCSAPIRGSRVTIVLPLQNRRLRLCEVEVYDKTCDCLEGCQVEQGFCFASCVRNPWCRRVNVALSKPADSSDLADISGPPSVVVNGNTGTVFVSREVTSDVKEQNCILTTETRSTSLSSMRSWWSVDLQKDVAIRGVVIYRANPEHVSETEAVTEITVDGQTCAKYSLDTLSPEEALRGRLVVPCKQTIRGRKVKITRQGTTTIAASAPLQLCEVQIWSCQPGWYGEQCNVRCGRCAGGRNVCDAITGLCPSDCQPRWYGSKCTKRCRSTCVDGVCEKDTGHCLQCPPNHDLPYCKECKDGWFGTACNQSCGACANSSQCNRLTGHCVQGCASGWLPPFCVEPAVTVTETSSTLITTSVTVASEGQDDDGGDDDDGSTVGMAAGAAVGVLSVIVIVLIILVVWHRRRRLSQRATTARPLSETGKPEAMKTESFAYIEAMSPHIDGSNAQPDTTNDVNGDANCYESLEVPTYENVEGDDHVYMMPVFKRGDSQMSTASGAYMNMGHSNNDAEAI